MNKTKQKILVYALDLFNKKGVSEVSIRQIAKVAGISHSNLIYHFHSKGAIVNALHDQLLAEAIKINQGIASDQFDIKKLYDLTKIGFRITYQYRFLFFDLLYICNTNPEMRKVLIEVAGIRSTMYLKVIQLSIINNLMRKEEYPGQYDQFIKRIKIFSDHWISSSSIYDDLCIDVLISDYSKLLLTSFYPYLTKEGKIEFEKQRLLVP